MEFIAHRINTIEELKKVPNEYGVELDLRDYGDKLILQHDPFTDGEKFEEYLKLKKSLEESPKIKGDPIHDYMDRAQNLFEKPKSKNSR